MDVVILYGAPAVGKLTVAKALSELTAYRVLHNHLLIDLSHSLFTDSSAKREATRVLREAMIDLAAKYKLKGLILTFVYAKDREAYMCELHEYIESKGHKAHFVHLHCSQANLEARVTQTSRYKYNKLTSIKGLKEKLESLKEPFGRFSQKRGLSICTDTYSAQETAKKILKSLALERL